MQTDKVSTSTMQDQQVNEKGIYEGKFEWDQAKKPDKLIGSIMPNTILLLINRSITKRIITEHSSAIIC